MSNFTDFFPAAGGGGGGIPKYQEFTSSGTFTPTQALIDAGGRLTFIIVAGGERGASAASGGAGGEVIWGYQTLTGTTACTVTIGAGGSGSNGANGGDSTVAFASAGGTTVTAKGGSGDYYGYTGYHGNYEGFSSFDGVLGYGQGGANSNYGAGNYAAGSQGDNVAAKYGSGTVQGQDAVDGFVRITWFE